jgi:hypothetical protein
MESSLALPCCVGSARLIEYILVCIWKFNSCSLGTQETELQRETIPLFALAGHNHSFSPEKEGLGFSAESLHFPAIAPDGNPYWYLIQQVTWSSLWILRAAARIF